MAGVGFGPAPDGFGTLPYGPTASAGIARPRHEEARAARQRDLALAASARSRKAAKGARSAGRDPVRRTPSTWQCTSSLIEAIDVKGTRYQPRHSPRSVRLVIASGAKSRRLRPRRLDKVDQSRRTKKTTRTLRRCLRRGSRSIIERDRRYEPRSKMRGKTHGSRRTNSNGFHHLGRVDRKPVGA